MHDEAQDDSIKPLPQYTLPSADESTQILDTMAAGELPQSLDLRQSAIRGGQTAFNTGKGFWLGIIGAIAKFSLGDPLGNYLTWDGVRLTISGNFTVGGYITTIGPTDNIQTAINLVNTNGGGTVFLKAGTYTISSPLTGYSSVKIVGISPSQTMIDFNGTSANLTFAGTSIYTTGTITSISGGVNVTGSGTSWLANAAAGQCLFLGTRWYTIAAVLTNTTLTLAEAYGDNVTMPGAAYRIASVLRDFGVSNVTLKNSTGTALVVTDSRQYNLLDVLCLSNNVGYSATNVSEQVINEFLAVANTSDGVQWTNLGLSNVLALNCIGNGGNGMTMSNVKTCNIDPGSFDSNTGDGVHITTGVNITLLGEMSGNGGQGVELVSGCNSVDILSTSIQNNTSDGIKLTASAINCTFSSINVSSNGGYGINVAVSGDTNNTIVANNFASNSSGAINDLGVGTVIRANVGAADNTISAANIQTYAPSAAGTATLDLSKGNVHHITMPAGNITIAIANAAAGQCFLVRILQDSSGSRTVTWFTTIRWNNGGTAPTLTTTANKVDTLQFEVTAAGSTYDGFVVGQNI